MKNRITIIIVNWNKKELLRGCLNSIYATVKNIEYRVVVVDNASLDGSPIMLREEFPWVEIIENSENFGFAKANNQAIRKSNSEYLLLLNNDTELLKESIQKMINYMDQNPEIGVIGPKLLNKDKSVQESYWMEYPSLWYLFLKYFYIFRILQSIKNKMNKNSEKPLKVAHILGACMLVRKKVIDDVDLLDEQYFMYLEETDWCYRMSKKEWLIYYFPEAQVIHFGQQSSRDNPLVTAQEEPKSYLKYFKKHYGSSPLKLILLKLIIIGGILIRITVYTVKYIICSDTFRENSIHAHWKVLKEVLNY